MFMVLKSRLFFLKYFGVCENFLFASSDRLFQGQHFTEVPKKRKRRRKRESRKMNDNLLFSEIYYATAVHESCFGTLTRKLCWGCFLSKEVHFCAECKTAAYCSKECQRKDWKTQHKEECDVFKNVKKDERCRKELGRNRDLRLAVRILIRKSKDGGSRIQKVR